MSAETMNAESTAVNAQVENKPGMGGTNAEGEVLADGAEDENVEEAEEAEGAEPEAETERTGEEPAPEKTKKLAPEEGDDELESLRQRVREADDLASIILSNPERKKQFQAWAKEDRGESEPSDSLRETEDAINEWFKDTETSANATALRAVTTPLIRKIRELETQMRGILPAVERSARLVTSSEFSRALAENGVGPEAQKTKEFQRFLARERKDRDFQKDESRRPGYAGRNLARAFRAETGQGTRNAARRERVDVVKNGALHAGNGVSGSAEKVYVYDPSENGWDNKLHAAREAARKRGEVLKAVRKPSPAK